MFSSPWVVILPRDFCIPNRSRLINLRCWYGSDGGYQWNNHPRLCHAWNGGLVERRPSAIVGRLLPIADRERPATSRRTPYGVEWRFLVRPRAATAWTAAGGQRCPLRPRFAHLASLERYTIGRGLPCLYISKARHPSSSP